MMAERRSITEERRVKELEDIICTLKFEINGLKSVVATVENEYREEREERDALQQGFQQRVQDVFSWLDATKEEVDKRANQILDLETKVRILETKNAQHAEAVHLYQEEITTTPINTRNNQQEVIDNCICHNFEVSEWKMQKEKIAALEKELQAETEKRKKAEYAYVELLDKYNQFKPKKEKDKKLTASLGIPSKLILPEAPAPKFWMQSIQPTCNVGVLSLNDILDGILRPFREDEIWALLYQVASLLNTLHSSGKIHGNISLDTIGSNYEGNISWIDVHSEAAPKFKPVNSFEIEALNDIFGLGVVLWSTSDFLLEDEEEPATSEELCILIGDMTSDIVAEVPSAEDLIKKSSTYAEASQTLFRDMLRELDRKKEMRTQYEKGIATNQGDVVKKLLNEISAGINLKKVSPAEPRKGESWQAGNAKMKLIRVA